MNVPAQQTARLTPVESYMLQVLDGRRADELRRALPAHIRPDLFERNLCNLLMQKLEILRFEPHLTFREVAKAAALGLLLDPQLGEAYIVPIYNGKEKRWEPQLRAGYRGLMKLARQSGDIADIYPNDVRENDEWDEAQGTERMLLHKINRRQPRGDAFAYYAVVVFKDGSKDFEVMSMDELFAIRDRSDGWKAYKRGKIQSTPWLTDEGQMCKKTVLRRLLNRIPQSPDLSQAMGMENHADYAPFTPRLLPQAMPAQQQIAAPAANQNPPAQPAAAEPAPIMIEHETVEAAAAPVAGDLASAFAAEPMDAANWDEADAEPDPVARARQAGWNAAEADVSVTDIPEEFSGSKALAAAWTDGFQRRIAQNGIEESFDDEKSRRTGRLRRFTRHDE